MNWSGKNILLTGGAGFLGSHVNEELLSRGAKEENIMIPRFENCDLREKENCKEAVKEKDIVIHLAANVGGIGYNQKYPADLFYDNIVMNTHLMEEARKEGVGKYVSLGTVCAYPKYTPVPFKEEDLWNGYPEETNAPYGLAKKMQLVQSNTYREQYGFNSIFLIPVNLYGPRDNFDPERSHVVPALIKKIYNAKQEGRGHITAWGTGKPTREFFYVEDAARGIVEATEKYDKSEPVNLGSGEEISIKALVELLKELMNFKGGIKWDTSKLDGQPRRKLDVSKAKKEFGFEAKVSLEEGLRKTIEWYLENKDNDHS
ncbi:GDP-L-fucose synthase [Patescibacteria group bacterium]|nr:GDP-L-fucose synthase [Patescibacteria group bacterium]